MYLSDEVIVNKKSTRYAYQLRLKNSAAKPAFRKDAYQYTIQSDLFSRAILENSEQAIALEDSVKNMSAVEAVFRVAESGNREIPTPLKHL